MKRILAFSIPLVVLATAVCSQAEEKSMWQKFVDFFNPSPTLEGEGPLYDQLKELDSKISKTEGQYSRERRPGNKSRLKKELENLRAERERLVQKIKEEEKNPKSSAQAQRSSSSSMQAKESAAAQAVQGAKTQQAAGCARDTVYERDTVFVKDTVVVHDTLYVIVADKPANAAPADSTPAPNKN